MKVVLNIFNLFDKPVKIVANFFDGYNVEMLIKTLFMNELNFSGLKFLDLFNLNITKECTDILLLQ